jgi:hypothetical protein
MSSDFYLMMGFACTRHFSISVINTALWSAETSPFVVLLINALKASRHFSKEAGLLSLAM